MDFRKKSVFLFISVCSIMLIVTEAKKHENINSEGKILFSFKISIQKI